MDDQQTHKGVEIDERYFSDFVAFGLYEIEGYLRNYWKFQQYVAEEMDA